MTVGEDWVFPTPSADLRCGINTDGEILGQDRIVCFLLTYFPPRDVLNAFFQTKLPTGGELSLTLFCLLS